MPLAESGHDRLVRLGVVVHLERRIFVVQAVKALLQLLFVGAVGRVHRHPDLPLRELDQRQTDRMRACGQRVVRVRVPELRDAADIARVQPSESRCAPCPARSTGD